MSVMLDCRWRPITLLSSAAVVTYFSVFRQLKLVDRHEVSRVIPHQLPALQVVPIELIPEQSSVDIRTRVEYANQNSSHNSSSSGSSSFPEPFHCDRNRYAVRSPEALALNRNECLDMTGGRCLRGLLEDNYGWTCSCAGRTPLQYVDISKSGSSTAKMMMEECHKHPACEPKWGYKGMTEETERDKTAFTIIRHPVKRFMSGYGTLLRRLEWFIDERKREDKTLYPMDAGRLRLIYEMEEPVRFRTFVDFFTQLGDTIIETYPFDGFDCGLLPHVMSQTWFMNLYPGKIHYVGKIENAADDIRRVIASVANVTVVAESKAVNKDEGGKNVKGFQALGKPWKEYMLAKERDAIEKLNSYFRPELEAFGYQPL